MKNSQESATPDLVTEHLGVWQVVHYRLPTSFKFPGQQALARWKVVFNNAAAHIIPFLRDIQDALGTKLFMLYVLCRIWSSIEDAVLLYLLGGILAEVEVRFTSEQSSRALGNALLVRLISVAVVGFIDWLYTIYDPVMRTRSKLRFQRTLMQSNLRLDLPTYQEKSNRAVVEAAEAWEIFGKLVNMMVSVLSTLSHVIFIAYFATHQSGGHLFAILCITKPLFTLLTTRNLWDQAFVAYSNNVQYLRSLAFYCLGTEEEYKQEVLSGGMEQYIIQEYERTRAVLSDTSDDFPSILYSIDPLPTRTIFTQLLGDLPLIYYAYHSLTSPNTTSIASIAMLQQTSSSLRDTFSRLAQQRANLSECVHQLESLYNGLQVKNSIPTGELPYPRLKSEGSSGMAISLQNICFQYPMASSDFPALKSITLDIPASSIVVIVGGNGSGKSSLIKLLTNLYHPTSGSILIDGHPSSEYRIEDLRNATAVLTQDHTLFPLPVEENIWMGDPACDEKSRGVRVQEALKEGGASHIIQKLSRGLKELAVSDMTSMGSSFPTPPGPLKDILKKVHESTVFSGGEKQRLVASRTFMRLASGKVKLVVVDEPTSAMDPRGEQELFERLRSARLGKTMIFVTHRFGHLTKYADLILCLKDGELIEQGTHQGLMEKRGEYYTLYNIQARAFSDLGPAEPNLE